MHRNHPRPKLNGAQRMPNPTAGLHIHHAQHTHKTLLTAAAQPALSHDVSQRHSLGQTPMPAKPRTPPNNPRTQRVINTHRPKSHPRCPARPEAHQNLIHNHQRTNTKPSLSEPPHTDMPATPALCRSQHQHTRSLTPPLNPTAPTQAREQQPSP